MKNNTPLLLLPVENQVREFDPKLLLACVAARRGFTSVLGSRRDIEFRIPSFPRSIYISKSVKSGNGRLFSILCKLGHDVVAWDEEALVHLPAETYYSRRLSPVAMVHVSHLFAWGEDSAQLWRRYPELPPSKPIHVTGNPRNDLLRTDIGGFYRKEVERLKESFGEFILVNTNFNHVNAFSPFHNLFQPVRDPDEPPPFGEAAKGMTREYAEGLRAHKQAVFEGFQQLIPDLERAFPDCTVVVRPHPTENQDVYHKIAAQCRRVRVTNEGNVVPWLMAARALIHNGCTTGVEAYVMRVPAVSYRIAVNDDYDLGFYRLPNLMSHQCFGFEELRTIIDKILSGEMGAAGGDERRALIDRHLAALEGPLACERIVDVLEGMGQDQAQRSRPPLRTRLDGWYRATKRMVKKRVNAYRQDSLNRPEFQRHRYPGISLEEVLTRTARFQEVLGDGRALKAEQISDRFFKIMP